MGRHLLRPGPGARKGWGRRSCGQIAARCARPNPTAPVCWLKPRCGTPRSATPNMDVWHRVIVLIEADVRCLADCDRHLLNDRIWIVRQLQKVRCLRGEGFADRDGVLIRQRRSAAAPQHQSSACALRSSTSVNRRPAKKPSPVSAPDGFFLRRSLRPSQAGAARRRGGFRSRRRLRSRASTTVGAKRAQFRIRL
jgi:hypothetical protein